MSDNGDEKLKIRRYLLGELATEAEIEELDSKILLDDAFYQNLLIEEEELIQDYADGHLSAAERESFETRFLISDERKQRLGFARALRKIVDEQRTETERAKPGTEHNNLKSLFAGFFATPFPALAALLVLCCAGLAVWYFALRTNEVDLAQALLSSAYSAERPFKTRVSEFSYAPFANTRGAESEKVNLNKRDQAELLLLKEVNEKPTAANLTTLGRLYLVKKDFDRAIAQFEKARRIDAADAAIVSDLGAARLEKAKTLTNNEDGESLMLAAQALEDFSSALEADPNLPQAMFNKAVALEVLNLTEQARQAWMDYLKLDDKSQWADEARKNIDALGDDRQLHSKTGSEVLIEFMEAFRARDGEAAYRTISRNREMITNKLVPQQLVFSFLDTPSPTDKSEYIEALRYAGQLELEKSGDPYVSDIAGVYEKASKNQIDRLREAARLVKSGYELSAGGKDELALEKFREARRIYAEAGSEPEALTCDYWIGYALNRTNKIKDSTLLLERLAGSSRKKNYKWLDSHANGWLSHNMIAGKKLTKAMQYNQEALSLSRAVSDLYNQQKTLSQKGELHRYAGDYQMAAIFTQQSLALAAAPEASPRQKWRDYTAAADVFFALKLYRVSSVYRKQSLQIALEQKDSTFVFVAYADWAAVARAMGRYDESFDLLNKSRRAAENIGNEEIRKRAFADSDLQTARTLRQMKNCPDALPFYGQAAAFYGSTDYRADLYEARKGRLLCYLETGDEAAFLEELDAVLKLFREYRTQILDERSRSLFFDGEQDVYDIAVDCMVRTSNYARAFEYSEESRARSLLDLQNSLGEGEGDNAAEVKFSSDSVAEPFPLSKIQEEMPENVQILMYSVLSDKTLIWVVTKKDLSVKEVSVSAQHLRELAERHREMTASAETPLDDFNDTSAELHRLLIAPVGDRLDREKKICLIPDKSLFWLSFAALSPPGGDYFVSEYDHFVTPSASIFLVSTEIARQRAQGATESVLSVGNPEFDRREFSDLPDLPSAEREAREVAGLYDRASLLIGREASEKSIRNRVGQFDVFHFAGHYIVDNSSPLLSGLILADESRDAAHGDSVLANYEIIRLRLPAARLIVLSACDTGGERVYKGEGMLGAARAFLAAGAPVVVAGRWRVDSDATAELMTDFHRHRRQGRLPASAALRQTQIDMISAIDSKFKHPYYWAAFTAFGGYAEF